jgi:hypothetical protein
MCPPSPPNAHLSHIESLSLLLNVVACTPLLSPRERRAATGGGQHNMRRGRKARGREGGEAGAAAAAQRQAVVLMKREMQIFHVDLIISFTELNNHHITLSNGTETHQPRAARFAARPPFELQRRPRGRRFVQVESHHYGARGQPLPRRRVLSHHSVSNRLCTPRPPLPLSPNHFRSTPPRLCSAPCFTH